MELPGFRCPPDVFTYTILISSYCRYGLETGCRKATRRRMWEANHIYYAAVNEIDKAVDMLRKMQNMKHGMPTSSSYTPIIHALCEAGRVTEARDFLAELIDGGSIPREYTYKLVCDALNSAGEIDSLGNDLHRRIKYGIESRYRQIMKVKPIMTRKGYDSMVET
ncbi:pentatricopeptide repeat-containing protein [Prunus yedoensis var. nudiflora]|uniref:Pentatricopeptide repeat-containing protein n=1 Tax=Prunus yedoensis var. nudiflora TaxID=2094558 RepID=A0A314UDZ2_PRUYE|nr:pentatricopeptide repeat-containing protein [Prunus yedoensis var. nudiflora]